MLDHAFEKADYSLSNQDPLWVMGSRGWQGEKPAAVLGQTFAQRSPHLCMVHIDFWVVNFACQFCLPVHRGFYLGTNFRDLSETQYPGVLFGYGPEDDWPNCSIIVLHSHNDKEL